MLFSTRIRLCRAIQMRTESPTNRLLRRTSSARFKIQTYGRKGLSHVRGAVETFVIDPKQRDSCLVALSGELCLYLGPSKICMPIDVYCLPLATCPWDDIDRKKNLSGWTASLKSWHQAKQWLRTCSNEHDKCQPRAETLPTRLLDLKVIASRDVKLLNISDSKVAEGMLCFFVFIRHSVWD